MPLPATERASHQRLQQAKAETAGLRPTTAVAEAILMRREARGESMRKDFYDWCLPIPEPKTGPLNFRIFPMQPEMYRVFGSNVRDVVVRKCTQVGISSLSVRYGLYVADRNGNTVLYVFPTEGDVYDFSDARVTPMIDGSEYLSGRRGEPYNKGLKRIGVGLVYFRGSENKRGLDSVDADVLILDEYDTLNQKNVPDAERRLSGVMSAGLIRRVGVPSLPEYGIASKYDISDRRKWLVQCPSCDHTGEDQETKEVLRTTGLPGHGWQEISFWRNVDKKNLTIVCQWCGQPIKVGEGQWTPQQPDGELPGFHVSRLIVPNMPLRDIVAASDATSPYEIETFYNKDLGLPYVSKESRLSPEEIHAAQSAAESWFGQPLMMESGYSGGNPVTMGIDMASERAMTVKISEHISNTHKRTLHVGETDDPEDLVRYMDRYRVTVCAIDSRPETRIARRLASAFPGRVYLVSYTTDAKDAFVVDDRMWTVSVDRTLGMDAMVELVRKQHNLLPAVLPDGYVAQMTSSIRRIKVLDEATGKIRVVWEATRADDYAHSEVYDVVATELYWRRMGINELTQQFEQPLDVLLGEEYRRATVNQLDDVEWHPGPTGDSNSMYGSEADPMYGLDDD